LTRADKRIERKIAMMYFNKMPWNLKGMTFDQLWDLEAKVVKAIGMALEIEFVQWMKVQNGKIVLWKSCSDPSEIVRALEGA
jgi:hypothetical protein